MGSKAPSRSPGGSAGPQLGEPSAGEERLWAGKGWVAACEPPGRLERQHVESWQSGCQSRVTWSGSQPVNMGNGQHAGYAYVSLQR